MPPDPRILVVDDDVGMVETLSDILEASHFRVDTAHSGDTAIRMTLAHPYDVILMDIQMPGLDGVQALRRIKSHAPQQNVIMMTAYTTDELAREALQATGKPVLPKPLDMDLVLKLVSVKEGQA